MAAFTLSAGKIELETAWDTALAMAQIDAVALAKLAQMRFDSGDFRAPPAPHPSAAILFTAAAAGVEGNGITVTVTPRPGGRHAGRLSAAHLRGTVR